MPHRSLYLAILILGLTACDNNTPKPAAANPAAPPAADKAAAQAQNSQAEKPGNAANLPPPPSGADAANLARAMGGGAAGIMPDDAPKDKYGKPYIIGDLGGVPVNLPPSVVEYVEYNDSPGFNPQALREFQPPVRSYDSVLTSFGFEFRLSDKQLYDRQDRVIYAQRKEDYSVGQGEEWIRVSILSGPSYGSNPDALGTYLEGATDKAYLEGPYILPFEYHELLPEKQYGLEVYASPGINPDTQLPWRQYQHAEDIFVNRDSEGKVQTYIRCGNAYKLLTCTHHINFPAHMRIRVSMWYLRAQLPQWQTIEAAAIELINSFQTNPQ